MTIRTILAAVSGSEASSGAAELACRLARRFEAHLEGFHARLDPAEIIAGLSAGGDVAISGSIVDNMTADAEKRAGETRNLFERIVARHHIAVRDAPTAGKAGASAAWRDEVGHAPTSVARRARFFDLTVLGRSDRVLNEPHSNTVEEALARSGRPVLLAPAQPPADMARTIAFAWNGSPQAVRAMAAALPFFATAKSVSVVTIGEADAAGAAAAVEYLAWHGIAARNQPMPTDPTLALGRQLVAIATQADADLLVMGGYGRAPWREVLFGGATREAVAANAMPILLVH